MRNVSTEKITYNDIPFYVLKMKNESETRGTIFIYHGWSSKKENYLFMGNIFALEGFRVIIPDSLHHGERGLLDYGDDKVMEQKFWEVAINSVDEYFLLKEYLLEQGMLNKERIAVMGNSMGGIISGGIFARDPEILTMIVMNGACAWLDVDQRVKSSRKIDRSAAIKPEKLEGYDPFRHLDKIFPRPFLLQHGEKDSSVPIETQEFFFEKAKVRYGELKERISFTRIPNLDHQKTVGMLEESVHWINGVFGE